MAFFIAPKDYQQVQTHRIMFIHVAFAWLCKWHTYRVDGNLSIGQRNLCGASIGRCLGKGRSPAWCRFALSVC